MLHPRTAVLTFFLAAALAAAPTARAQTAVQGQALARALDQAERGDWDAAETIAAGVGNAVARDIVRWLRLREGQGTWAEYQAFLAANPGWPNLATIRRQAEGAMPAQMPPDEVLAFFGADGPATGAGVLRQAEALTALGRADEAEAAVTRAWREMALGLTNQAAIAARYGDVLAPHHVERTDMLLWRGLTAEAAGMLDRVPAAWRPLAEARIAVRNGADGSTALIDALPAALREDPGLVYERYLYRVGKGRWDEVEAYSAEVLDLGRGARPTGPVDGAPRQPGPRRAAPRRRRDRLCPRRREFRHEGLRARLRRRGVGGGLRRPVGDGQPDAGGDAFRALRRGGRHPDQPRARRLLARAGARTRRRRRRRARGVRRGRAASDELLRPAGRGEGRGRPPTRA